MLCMLSASSIAATTTTINSKQSLWLQKQPSFFRFSFDNIKMPQNIQKMGLLGVNYFVDLSPSFYAGVGTYGSVTGSQGGLFVLGFEGGVHHPIINNWWGDAGVYVGGGGGHSSYVGGGLMLRPHVGLEYNFNWARLGLHYSYITFPTGRIHSSQVGLDLDIPYDFYYVRTQDMTNSLFNFKDVHLFDGKYLSLQRNDFGLFLQAYIQKKGVQDAWGNTQDDTMGLVGAEFDHYMTDRLFGYAKASGAFSGVPNGYMDITGGLGYHYTLGSSSFALIPQFGAGAGGGGNVDTGGGIIINPQLGMEWPLSRKFSMRMSGGYLWAPYGQLKAYTATGMILYHLDLASGADAPTNQSIDITTQQWRIQLFNQTYIHPQRINTSSKSPNNLIVLQFDQLFTPYFFFSYQAASAYSGSGAGGLASGMIGPGLQTAPFCHQHLRLFAQVLIGAAGGGKLALGGGSVVEPVVGLHYAFTPQFGLQTSVGQIKALKNKLNTPVFNLGFSIQFGTLNKA